MLLKLSLESPLFIFLIVISFLLVTFTAWLSQRPLALRPFGFDDIMQLLALPFFISLLLERSLEVFITTWRGPTTEQLEVSIQQQNFLLTEKRKLIAEQQQTQIPYIEPNPIQVNQSGGTTLEQQLIQDYPPIPIDASSQIKVYIDELNNIINNLNTIERQRLAYKSNTRIIALWTSLLCGLLISAIGIRSLEPLIILDANNPIQLIIFRCFDAFLTGGLIAGGSEGIHKFTQVFTDFLEATSRQAKDRRL
ncbi:hypothetical protein H6G33_17185 [Calothrix sp. FACHB-1219]|uniref:hypothetical protein n=1 Tax=unclassified Calothrix TaxID=2619626 RepID=UPI001681CEBF|nr:MULTISPECIES: hypothetical protein [unclassified Calothrix]MBD2203169.1 hypothetical protein [Calothrix sp. FACHB-168]MBD2218769.1 hypothetical protein [Calothrix sp. FACHB-1219]